MFVTVSNFHPSIIFASKAGAYQTGDPDRTELLWLDPVFVER